MNMKRKNWVLALAVLILISILYASSLNSYLSLYGDDAVFIMLAESMLKHGSYREVGMVGEPPHTQFPFVFPIMLMPIIAIFGINILAMKILVTVVAVASIFLIWLFNNKMGKSGWTAIIVALLSGLSPHTGEFTHKVMSEYPYVFFSFLAVIFLTKYQKQERWLTRAGIAAAVFITIAYFTRSIGLFLFFGGLIYIFLEGISKVPLRLRWKKVLLIALVFIIAAAAWEYRNQVVTKGKNPPYFNQFLMRDPYNADLGTIGLGELLARARDNFSLYKQVFTVVTVNNNYTLELFNIFLPNAIFCLMLFSYIYCLIKRRTVVEYIFPAYMLVVYIWPWSGIRFIMPIIPFLLYYMVIGVRELLSIISKVRRDIFVCILILPLLIIFVFSLHTHIKTQDFSITLYAILLVCAYVILVLGRLLRKIRITTSTYVLIISIMIAVSLFSTIERNVLPEHTKPYYKGQWGEFYEMSQWIRENTAPESFIMSRKPSLYYFWSGRKQAIYPFTYDKSAVIDSIYKNKVNYVAVDSFTWTRTTSEYLVPALEEQAEKFALVHEIGKSKIYEVK